MATFGVPRIARQHLEEIRRYAREGAASAENRIVEERLFGDEAEFYDMKSSGWHSRKPAGRWLLAYAVASATFDVPEALARAAGVAGSERAADSALVPPEIVGLFRRVASEKADPAERRLLLGIQREVGNNVERAYRYYKRRLRSESEDEQDFRIDVRVRRRLLERGVNLDWMYERRAREAAALDAYEPTAEESTDSSGPGHRVARRLHDDFHEDERLFARWRGQAMTKAHRQDLELVFTPLVAKLCSQLQSRREATFAALVGNERALPAYIRNADDFIEPLLAVVSCMDVDVLRSAYGDELGEPPILPRLKALDYKVATRTASRQDRHLFKSLCIRAARMLDREYSAFKKRGSTERFYDMNIDEAARAIGKSKAQVYREIAAGTLKKARSGKIRIWQRDARRFVRKWFADCRRDDLDVISDSAILDWLEQRACGGTVATLGPRQPSKTQQRQLERQIEAHAGEDIERENAAAKIALIVDDDPLRGWACENDEGNVTPEADDPADYPDDKPPPIDWHEGVADARSLRGDMLHADGPDKPDHADKPDGDTAEPVEKWKHDWIAEAELQNGHQTVYRGESRQQSKDKAGGERVGAATLYPSDFKAAFPYLQADTIRALGKTYLLDGRPWRKREGIPCGLLDGARGAGFWREGYRLNEQTKKDRKKVKALVERGLTSRSRAVGREN